MGVQSTRQASSALRQNPQPVYVVPSQPYRLGPLQADGRNADAYAAVPSILFSVSIPKSCNNGVRMSSSS